MTPCSVPGCGRPAWARGWCTRHYRRWQRTGAEPTPECQVGEPDGYGRYGIIERRPRNPWLQPWGGKGGYLLRWFSTYCLTISKGAPPTVATK